MNTQPSPQCRRVPVPAPCGGRFARRARGSWLAAALICLATPAGAASSALPFETRFELQAASEVVATIAASCAGCSWQRPGSEAAVLALRVDGRYSQHLFLVRGEQAAEYRVALGRLEKGRHRLSLALDREQTPKAARRVSVESVVIRPGSADEATALAHAPVLYARADTIGRFSDVPLVMWYETDATEGGMRLRYSVVFSNEDGGTPSDKLMATWGRLTDIEYVYGVLLSRDGRVLSEEFQGPGHKFVAFAGAHEAAHPLMYVVTDNNMVSDTKKEGTDPSLRFALIPTGFDLAGTSREAVMDESPWTYRVSVQEARREGRVKDAAAPGSERIPDPRRFATLEACAPAEDATLAFSLGLRAPGGETRFIDSSGGLPSYRIGRKASEFPNGCFRGAVALPTGVTGADIVALRFSAFTRIPSEDEPPLPKGKGSARLERVNKLFLLGEDDAPGPSLFSWKGDEPLVPEGPFVELKIR